MGFEVVEGYGDPLDGIVLARVTPGEHRRCTASSAADGRADPGNRGPRDDPTVRMLRRLGIRLGRHPRMPLPSNSSILFTVSLYADFRFCPHHAQTGDRVGDGTF